MKKLFKEHDLVKVVSIVLLLLVVMTWFIPYGQFGSSATFTEGEVTPIGIVHIIYGFIYAIQNYAIQIAFLILIGMFYGVVTKTESYKALVSRIAKSCKGIEIVVSLVISFIIALLASFLNNTYVLLFFMPFLVSILRRIGLDKISSFAITFGSIFVGVLGATYGTEGFIGFVEYVGMYGGEYSIATEIIVRAGVLLLAYILFSFFNVIYIKKILEKKDRKEEVKVIDDKFAVEEPKKKNTKIWLQVVLFVLLFVFMILGFITWNTTLNGTEVFGIPVFDDFHEWFMGLSIGENEFAIFNAIFGGSLANFVAELVPAFGNWYLFTYSIVIIFAMVVIAIASKMSVSEFITNIGEGFKKVIRPIMLLVLAYMAFIFLYWVPIIPTILHEIGNLASGFNPFVATLQAFIGSIFNSDFGYLAYTVSPYIAGFSGAEGNLMLVIYTTIYGLVQFITPISVFLLFGLSYMNIPYKKWLKYIWKFFVGMLVCLLVIFTLLAYL